MKPKEGAENQKRRAAREGSRALFFASVRRRRRTCRTRSTAVPRSFGGCTALAQKGLKKRTTVCHPMGEGAGFSFLFFSFACSASLVTTPSFKWSIFLRTSIHSKRDSVILGFFRLPAFLGRGKASFGTFENKGAFRLLTNSTFFSFFFFSFSFFLFLFLFFFFFFFFFFSFFFRFFFARYGRDLFALFARRSCSRSRKAREGARDAQRGARRAKGRATR